MADLTELPEPPDAALADAWEAARAAWPGVDLDVDAFVRHVRARLPGPFGPAEATGQLTDLYLVAACLEGRPGAIVTLDRVFLARVDEHVRRIDSSHAFIDEVRQQLRERLLMARADGPARLADYAGRGPLSAWLRVAAVRIALNLVAERRPERQVELDDALLAAPDGWDPELELVRSRYAPMLRAAVKEAFAKLTNRQRNMLRLHLVGGLTTARIAAVYRVDASTITRWLQAVRAEVRSACQARLEAEAGIPADELASLAGLLLSQLDVSLAGLLRDTQA
jgi:RNA polymerase sigma-70 factor (ECF subfamily)